MTEDDRVDPPGTGPLPADLVEQLRALGRFYDLDGHPCSVFEWGELTADRSRAQIGYTEVGPRVVSTVYVGHPLSPGLFRPEPSAPLIFETMVFPDDQVTGRYPTRAEAEQGHVDTVTLLRATDDIPTLPPE